MKNERGRKVEVIGEVISSSMSKTITVVNYRLVKHGKYGKFVKKSTTFKAHDELETAKVGDRVVIRESKPISKTKKWKLVEILSV